MSIKRWFVAAVMAAVMIPTGWSRADNKTFLGTTQYWTDAANWSPTGVPTAGDSVSVGSACNRTGVYIGTTGAQCGSLSYSGSGPMVVYGGNLSVGGMTSVSGSGSPCIVLMSGGTLTTYLTTLGEFSGSKGDVAVFGTGSKWSCLDHLMVGTGGTGTVKASGGGSIVAKDCAIDGQRTSSVTLDSGGTMTTGSLYMAPFGTGTATVKIDGTGSRMDVTSSVGGGDGSAIIGHGGNGRVEVTGGGTLSTASASVGLGAGGTGTVILRDAGSTWTNAQSILVGPSGKGTIQTMPNTTMDAGMELRICSADDTVDVGGTLRASQVTNNGTFSVGAGSVTADSLSNNVGGKVMMSGGRLSVHSFSSNGMFDFRGGELHAGTITGTLFMNGGKLCVDETTRQSLITGSVWGNGSVGISINGTSASGLFDHIVVQGDWMFSGKLDVAMLNSYQLGLGQRYEVIDIVGDYSRASFTGLAQNGLVGTFGGVNLYIDYFGGSGNDVVLYTVPEPMTLALLAAGGWVVRRARRA